MHIIYRLKYNTADVDLTNFKNHRTLHGCNTIYKINIKKINHKTKNNLYKHWAG